MNKALCDKTVPATLGAEGHIGLSVVCAIRNRLDNLVKALPTWLACPEIDEVVLIDWGSTPPLWEGLAAARLDDPRLTVLRVEGQTQWCLTLAFNLGFRIARYDRILKLDADICLARDFFVQHPLGADEFYAGDWRAYDAGQAHLNGVFYMHRCDLAKIGGFNEYIRSYGYDDDDLYARATAAGLKRHLLVESSLLHLPHPDQARLQQSDPNQPQGLGWAELWARPIFHIRANRILSLILPTWCGGWTMQPFDLVSDPEGRAIYVTSKSGPHSPPDEIRYASQILAARELLSWQIGRMAFAVPQAKLEDLLRDCTIGQIADRSEQAVPAQPLLPTPLIVPPAPARLFLDLHHGLGNRLRALASGLALAGALARQPVIIWQADDHCGARFADLFDSDLPVIEARFGDAAAAMGIETFTYLEDHKGALPHDAAVSVMPNRDAYIASACRIPHPLVSWDAENTALRGLRVSRDVRDLIAELPPRFEIGIHMRTHVSDAACDAPQNWRADSHERITLARQTSQPARFLPRLEAALSEWDKDVRVFLAADHPQAYEAMISAYGSRRFFTLTRETFDRSATQIKYALGDMLALSRAQLLLGSDWSAFSECAHRLAPAPQIFQQAGRDF
ncbi:galactosyltransferase-related protein [Rhodobacteraceae bacterium XHP0102]|nr:galactosyltransferase-related protein [Rhodobacteraceae bacterium XHP0102]